MGIFCLSFFAGAALYVTDFFRNYYYTINTPKLAYLGWQYWILAFFGAFFCLEYIEYKKKRTSLLKDTLHGYYNPLLAILTVSVFLAITNEIQNTNVYLWKYANYPWPNLAFFNVPAFIVLAWPLHFIIFLECWRAFGTNTSRVIYENEKLLVIK